MSVGGGASNGNVTVTAVSGCAWTATSGAAWLTITAGGGGSGNGVVSYAVAANTTTAQRQGNLSIAGQTFTVTQAAGCTYSITPTATNVAAGASTGNVAVSAGASCQWSASSSAAWISITGGASGSGPGTVSYSVAANTGTTSRTGSATIAGQTFSVTQDGVPCSYTLNPVSATLGPAAGSGTVGVTAQTGCSWTAASGAAWITVTSGASGSANGQVGFSVTANPTTSSRSGAITIGGRPFNVTQTGQSCTYSISPVNTSVSASAATGNFNVTALTGCAWTATSSGSWITITSGATGSGNGPVGYSIAANPNVASRTGSISVGGQTYTVNQAGVVCTPTLNPLSSSVGAGGSTGNSVSVAIPAACQWTATSNAQWLSVTNGASGTGNGSVVYNVAANTSTSSRSASLTIAGQPFNVSQAGLTCTYTVTPTNAPAPNTAGTGSVSVAAATGCNWQASSSVAWLTVTSGASGAANGSVNYSFVANPTTQSRQGVLTVAGQPVTITQAAGCGYSITPASASVTAAAGSGTVNVTAGGTCAWSATSPVQWITFTAPASGSGNGSVGYNVAANTNSSSRSATITVAGQPFVVTQAGAACDATLNPASQNFTVAGGNGGTAVTVPAGCTWSAVPSAAWITVLTGATGSGNGNVTYSVSANPNGTTRNGTIAIGGKLLNVTQDAAACTSTVSSTSESFESTGGTRSVSVTTPAGCSWTAASNSQWITVTSGAGPNTSGNGAVTFQVAANATTTARTGSLTIAGKTVNVNQAGTCDVTLAPTGVSAGAAASTGLVGVATGSTCTWSATSSAAWLTVTSGGSGTGNGTVGYAVTANTGAARTASLTIGGRQFSVQQAAPGCTVSLSPTSIALTPGIAFRGITVTAGAGCTWTTTNTASWITVTSGLSGTGNGSVFMNIAANNTNAERTAILTIGGQQATITQAGQGCAITLSPVSVTVPASGSSGAITVAGSIACTWTATSNVPWLTVTGGGSGTGNGTVQYTAAANTTSTQRTGVIAIAGRTFTVTQQAAVAPQALCNATLSSNGMSIPSSALNISVGVSVTDGCSWTATSTAAWISVAAPAGGQGSGRNVGFAIAQNPGSSTRVGSANVAGKTFQVTQAGACQYSVTPTTVSLGSAAGAAGVSVTAGVGCEWTAQSSVPWITLNSSSGTGGGTVGLNVSANTTSSARSATLTIAGTSVTVNQQAGAACTVTVSPRSLSPHFKGSDESLAITTSAGCAWSATTSVQWLTFPRGNSGTGGGTLAVRVPANTTGEARVGMIVVGGASVTVTQRSGKAPKPPVGVVVQEPQKEKQ